MSTNINLLPDVRQAKLREQSRRRSLTTLLVVFVVVVVGIIVLLVLISVGQTVTINSLTGKIHTKQSQLQSDADLAKALTAQKQLSELSSLYSSRVYASHFLTQISAVMPVGASIQTVANAADGTLTATAKAKDLATADKFVKALAASNVTVGPGSSSSNTPDFSNVKPSSFTVDDKGSVSFTLTAKVDQGLYGHGR